jgi:hypothetical protein
LNPIQWPIFFISANPCRFRAIRVLLKSACKFQYLDERPFYEDTKKRVARELGLGQRGAGKAAQKARALAR